MFSDAQKQQLGAPLSRSAVKGRKQGGRDVSYVEGWHVIAEANRIFGFDGWTRETVEFKCVAERERDMSSGKGWGVSYTAKVRVTVGTIVREGVGAGHGIDRDCGQAHESAIKEAETDAMKRALMTFGNPFGLALYDKEQANVADESKIHFLSDCEAAITTANNASALRDWWNSDEQKTARRQFDLTNEEVNVMKANVMAKIAQLSNKEAA